MSEFVDDRFEYSDQPVDEFSQDLSREIGTKIREHGNIGTRKAMNSVAVPNSSRGLLESHRVYQESRLKRPAGRVGKNDKTAADKRVKRHWKRIKNELN